jgi:hypothetical protein
MSRERNLRFATIALVGGSLLFGYALVRALVVSDPVDVASPPSGAPAVQKAAPSVEQPINSPVPAKKVVSLTTNALQLAVETDPFQPDRVRAPERYRFPGEEVIVPEVAPPPPEPPRPQFRVIGVIAGEPGSGTAVIETPTGSRVVNVGETLNGFTLASVSGRTATVQGNGRNYDLRVEDAVPTRPGRAGRAGRAGAPPAPAGRGGNAPNQNQLIEAIERMRQMGVGGETLQQMMRMLETQGGRGGAQFQNNIQLRGDMIEVTRPGNAGAAERVIIRPRVDTMIEAAAPRRRN